MALPAAIAANRKVSKRISQGLLPEGKVKLCMGAIIIASPQDHTTLQAMTTRLHLYSTKRFTRRFAAGFTLIELMVVLLIIGVLAALVVPNVLDRADDARVTAAKTDVTNLMQALKLYRLDNQRYPSAEQGLQALLTKPTTSPVPNNWKTYLDQLPKDPWGQAYVYLNPGIKGEVDVMSYGADGQSGGDGKNADIGSWQP